MNWNFSDKYKYKIHTDPIEIISRLKYFTNSRMLDFSDPNLTGYLDEKSQSFQLYIKNSASFLIGGYLNRIATLEGTFQNNSNHTSIHIRLRPVYTTLLLIYFFAALAIWQFIEAFQNKNETHVFAILALSIIIAWTWLGISYSKKVLKRKFEIALNLQSSR